MRNFLSYFSVYWVACVISSVAIIACPAQADNTDIVDNSGRAVSSQSSKRNTIDATLERMPDEELIMMAKRIHQSRLATAELFNQVHPDKLKRFGNRREVIEYIKNAMAENETHGYR